MSEHVEIQVDAGMGIGAAAAKAVRDAGRLCTAVHFAFNGVPVVARPSDSVTTIIDLWDARREAIVRGWRP